MPDGAYHLDRVFLRRRVMMASVAPRRPAQLRSGHKLRTSNDCALEHRPRRRSAAHCARLQLRELSPVPGGPDEAAVRQQDLYPGGGAAVGRDAR